MLFQPQQQMKIQHQIWKNSNGGGQENGRGNNRAKKKETATTATEATTEKVGIQAMQTATAAEDNNSNHEGVISPPENSYTPKT